MCFQTGQTLCHSSLRIMASATDPYFGEKVNRFMAHLKDLTVTYIMNTTAENLPYVLICFSESNGAAQVIDALSTCGSCWMAVEVVHPSHVR
ncbi:unnamed protein product [Didymodactylos carnosus]|uniref:Uncharacterized protein n=1 Tax=Didymodactylos carnosus TaxID=1234261 RepID=A0A815GE06_9BILA|nr:unnamed protein product [Didymodactylos carnosus]CAF1337405.1 unnamed protein product [Didymodactylos carnosus]CAF3857596.1 unnamed protein product [Didymodactylos carnosus]CAF4195893.1 unnamed protein product [Didymodactylos carnosus]